MNRKSEEIGRISSSDGELKHQQGIFWAGKEWRNIQHVLFITGAIWGVRVPVG